MLFGLTNTPAVFQRLMQKVLSSLKTDKGKDFVEVYIDVLIFSETQKNILSTFVLFRATEESWFKVQAIKVPFSAGECRVSGSSD